MNARRADRRDRHRPRSRTSGFESRAATLHSISTIIAYRQQSSQRVTGIHSHQAAAHVRHPVEMLSYRPCAWRSHPVGLSTVGLYPKSSLAHLARLARCGLCTGPSHARRQNLPDWGMVLGGGIFQLTTGSFGSWPRDGALH